MIPSVRAVALTVLAAPWFVAGFVAGALVDAARWCVAAVMVGFEWRRRAR